jgi:hypothetical protein
VTHTQGKGEIHTGYLRVNLKNRNRLEYIGVSRGIILNCLLKQDGKASTGLTWLRAGIDGGPL